MSVRTIATRRSWPSVRAAGLLAALIAIWGLLATAAPVSAAPAGSPWGNGYIPNVPVVDQNGKALHFYDDLVKGKLVVVNFIYTNCRDICPLVTARLARLADVLGDSVGRDIFFISVAIDPEHDTPERLKEHAEAFGVGRGWTFVTGRKADIDLIRNRLGERSRFLSEHRNELLLGNDRNGSWARDSAFADVNVLASNVRDMNPEWLYAKRTEEDGSEAAPKSAPISHEPPGQTLFAKTCANCHTVGKGRRVGPDLAGVLDRRPRAWVRRYIEMPDIMRSEHDPIADELRRQFRVVRMPNLGLSSNDIDDVLSYITAQSAARDTAQAPAAAPPASTAR